MNTPTTKRKPAPTCTGLYLPRRLQLRMKLNLSVQTVKEDPQPQVVVAFGLRMTNWAPCSPSV